MKNNSLSTSFPSGWFRVAYSDELPPGKVIPLHYFSKDLVLFRTQDGNPHILDAHCPHLGAHLGHGGQVKAQTIQCPFHGWCFDGNGQCVEIPYASKIPPKAQIKTWVVQEVNSMIMDYYHPDGANPTWEIPVLPEYTSSDWIPFQRHRWKVRTNIYEVAENGVDIAHALFVHSESVSTFKSHALVSDGVVSVHQMDAIYKLLNQKVKGSFEVTSYGLGCHFTRAVINTGFKLEFMANYFLTPIYEKYLEADLVFTMKKILNKQLTKFVITPYLIEETCKTFQQDINIRENQIFRVHPLLCDGDEPIKQYRNWARQFYSHS